MAKKVKTPPPAPSYFDVGVLTQIREKFGAPYVSNSTASNWFNDAVKSIDFLIYEIDKSKKLGLSTVYTEKLNSQPGKHSKQTLKTYVVRGYSTIKNDRRIFIEVGISDLHTNAPKFNIQFDYDKKLELPNPFNQFFTSPKKISYDLSIPFDNTFPKNWTDLINKIDVPIENMVKELKKLHLPPGGGTPVTAGNQPMPEGGHTPNLNSILYGPPGTGKTFHSITHAVAIIDNRNIDELIELSKAEAGRKDIKDRYDYLFESGNIAFTTFHQSLSYEDFIEGIKPLEPAPGEPMQYDIVDGIFKKMCDKAEKCVSTNITKGSSFDDALEQLEAEWRVDPTMSFELTRDNKGFTLTEFKSKNIRFKKASGGTAHSLSKKTLSDLYFGIRKSYPSGIEIYYKSVLDKLKTYTTSLTEAINNSDSKPCKFVLIVDEINRGNVSQIFGELITLLEPDKRIGEKEEIRLTLPYSKEEFGVPSNVYIIGTMNTADRSVEALDTALRRRFSFIPMMPEYDGLNEECDGVNLKLLLKKLNDRLTVLKDRDHTIGHAWLWNTTTIDSLRLAFKDKIIPLLQEFFYNDYEKLGLLLGDSFIQTEVTVNNNLFAPFRNGSGLRNQYANKVVYKITEPSSWTSEAFQSIYINQEN